MNAIESIFRAVVDGSWRMACLILIFLALRPFLRGRISARALYLVWIAVAIRLLVPFSVPATWSPFNLLRLAHRDSPAVEIQAGALEPSQPDAESPQPARSAPTGSPEARPVFVSSLSPVQWAASAWALGVAVLLVFRIQAHCRFARRLRHSHPAAGSTRPEFTAETAAELGIRGVRIAVTDSVGTPALYGFLRPVLLLPSGLLERLSQREIELIVAHELGHHQRHDLLAQALLQAARILHWFNPLVWIAVRAARHDCELACDEHVVRRLSPAEPQDYGATLLKIVGMAAQTSQAPLGLGIVETKQQITRRIQMIVANKPSSFFRTVFGCTVLALVAGLCLTRESQAQPQPAATGPAITTEAPSGWFKNGTDKPGNVAYVVGLDRSQTHAGLPSAYVKSIKPVDKGFGGMMQMCSADNFIGKRLRLSAWMKTEKADAGGAHLWFRVDGKETQVLQFDNMGPRPALGTTDWTQYSEVLDIPTGATALAYGFFVEGSGQAWVSGVKIEEVGMDVPSTNMPLNRDPALPNAPVNLDFSGSGLSDAHSNPPPPKTDTAGKDKPEIRVTINIDHDGKIEFNGKPIADDQLATLLADVIKTDRNTPVLIKAEEAAQLKQLEFVWDTCRKAGLTNIHIQTR
jgi:beta-lactamase regulating signal transducer with metallopeptidase domain